MRGAAGAGAFAVLTADKAGAGVDRATGLAG